MAAALMEMDELVGEFLLRLPPDDPASLVRAALVCKLLRRILAARGFRRRFRDFHRTPRLLGVIHCRGRAAPCFAPTSAFRPHNALPFRYVHDSHHGRVLSVHPLEHSEMDVWDPITGEKLQLPSLELPHEPSDIIHLVGWNAAVLCASSWNSSCDHLDCDCRHFLVVFISSSPRHGVYVYVYSSEAGSWALTASAAQHPVDPFYFCYNERSTLAGSALHFIAEVKRKMRICKYNLDTQEISWIKLPPSCSYQYQGYRALLTSTQYGGLGCARLENSRLHLWSREVGSDGLFEWAQTRVIELEPMLPSINRFSTAAFVDGVGVLLVTTADGLFSIDLDSDRATKVCEGREINNVIPYVSFCSTAAPRVGGLLGKPFERALAAALLVCVVFNGVGGPEGVGSSVPGSNASGIVVASLPDRSGIAMPHEAGGCQQLLQLQGSFLTCATTSFLTCIMGTSSPMPLHRNCKA